MYPFFGMHRGFGIPRYIDSRLYTKYSVYHGILQYRKIDTVIVPVSYRTENHGISKNRYFQYFFGTISALFRYFGIFVQP